MKVNPGSWSCLPLDRRTELPRLDMVRTGTSFCPILLRGGPKNPQILLLLESVSGYYSFKNFITHLIRVHPWGGLQGGKALLSLPIVPYVHIPSLMKQNRNRRLMSLEMEMNSFRAEISLVSSSLCSRNDPLYKANNPLDRLSRSQWGFGLNCNYLLFFNCDLIDEIFLRVPFFLLKKARSQFGLNLKDSTWDLYRGMGIFSVALLDSLGSTLPHVHALVEGPCSTSYVQVLFKLETSAIG